VSDARAVEDLQIGDEIELTEEEAETMGYHYGNEAARERDETNKKLKKLKKKFKKMKNKKGDVVLMPVGPQAPSYSKTILEGIKFLAVCSVTYGLFFQGWFAVHSACDKKAGSIVTAAEDKSIFNIANDLVEATPIVSYVYNWGWYGLMG